MVFRKTPIAKLTQLAPCNTLSEPTLSMSLTLKFNERIPLVAAFANLCQDAKRGAQKNHFPTLFIHACSLTCCAQWSWRRGPVAGPRLLLTASSCGSPRAASTGTRASRTPARSARWTPPTWDLKWRREVGLPFVGTSKQQLTWKTIFPSLCDSMKGRTTSNSNFPR